eukprot:scaffold197244_cov36-Tisochrysis_lutea.AAC.2
MDAGCAGACTCSVSAKCANAACPCVRAKVPCCLVHLNATVGAPLLGVYVVQLRTLWERRQRADVCSSSESEAESVCSCMQD